MLSLFNNYITFQWGRYTSTANTGCVQIKFPIVFSKIFTGYNVVNNVDKAGLSDNYSYVRNLANDGMEVGWDRKNCIWLAIGY